MISKQFTKIRDLSNNDVTKIHSKKSSNDIQQFSRISETLSIDSDTQYDEHRISDWTDHRSSSVNRQLDAIEFLQEQLQSEKKDILIDLLYRIAHEINIDQHYSHSAVNNNHFHVTRPIWNGNLQLSNNKDKKNKNEKTSEQEKKDSNEKKLKKEDKKKETDDKEAASKKPKKKSKKVEETAASSTDSENIVHSPVVVNSTREYPKTPRSPSYSPAETLAFSTLSIPVPQPGLSFSNGLSTPDPSRHYRPQQSNIAHLSQVQHQLQTDPQTSSSNRAAHGQGISVQQQLQSLSQMARDGEEILITLNVNALTPKQQTNQHSTQPSLQNNPYSFQSWNQMIPSSTAVGMPRALEIVAKGYARVKNEHSQPFPSPSYVQQQPNISIPSFFAPPSPISCYSGAGPPQMPIGPPIQPVFPAPHMPTSNGYSRSPPSGNDSLHRHPSKCDYLCQSSFNEPDFRGRPSPGVTINPYFFNRPPPSMNYSAKSSSKSRKKHSSRKRPTHYIHSEHINRTCSSIY